MLENVWEGIRIKEKEKNVFDPVRSNYIQDCLLCLTYEICYVLCPQEGARKYILSVKNVLVLMHKELNCSIVLFISKYVRIYDKDWNLRQPSKPPRLILECVKNRKKLAAQRIFGSIILIRLYFLDHVQK